MAARKRRQKGHGKDRPVVAAAMEILNAGQSSKFQYEGAVRHGLRAGFCLEGLPWAKADARAAVIVEEALRRIGAERPTWQQGQPEWTQEGYAPVERYFCAWCGSRMPEARNRNGVAKKYCSQLCGMAASHRKARVSGEQMSLAEYLAACAARTERTRRERARPCKRCGKQFTPAADRLETAQYCSHECYWVARPAYKFEPRPCAVCGKLFSPGRSGAIYCSKACNMAACRRRFAQSRQAKQCGTCGAEFQAKDSTARFCSRACALESGRVKRWGTGRRAEAANGFRCDAVK